MADTTNPSGFGNSDGVVSTEDASTLTNSPISSGPFYGYIRTFPVSNHGSSYCKIFRIIYEIYPIHGRLGTNAYNPDTMSGDFGKDIYPARFKMPNVVDLNTIIPTMFDSQLSIDRFSPGASNVPTRGSGVVGSFRDNSLYGWQFVIIDGTLYSRYYSNGVYRSGKTIG